MSGILSCVFSTSGAGSHTTPTTPTLITSAISTTTTTTTAENDLSNLFMTEQLFNNGKSSGVCKSSEQLHPTKVLKQESNATITPQLPLSALIDLETTFIDFDELTREHEKTYSSLIFSTSSPSPSSPSSPSSTSPVTSSSSSSLNFATRRTFNTMMENESLISMENEGNGDDNNDDDDDFSSVSSFSISTPAASTSTRGRKPKSAPPMSKSEKYLERRRKNNEAAKRCRDSKKMKEEACGALAASLQVENEQLRSRVNTLEQEIASLKSLLLERCSKSFPSSSASA